MSPDNPDLFPDQDKDAQQQDEDDDEDDLSITSTNADSGNDNDKEWDVDDILAERQNPEDPSVMQYLIKWEGYALEDCTWEPLDHLGDGLLTKWDENKAEIEAKTREPFDLALLDAALAERAERHRRRNAKRQRLGMPLTPPFPPKKRGNRPARSSVDPDFSSSDDEAQEIYETESVLMSPPRAKSKPKPKPAVTDTTLSKPPVRTTAPGGFFSKNSSLWKRNVSTTTGGTMTGYQGTAGRSSVFRPPTAKTPGGFTVTKPPPAAAGSAGPASKQAKNLKSKPLKATRTHQQPAPGAVNVFAGGKMRKKRPTLVDVMADPSKPPKAFANLRMVNIAKKRAIEKADSVGALASIPSKFIIGNDNADAALNRSLTTAPPSHGTPHASAMSSAHSHELQAPAKSALHGGQNEGPPAKRKKSVRFTGEDNDEQTGIIESPTEVRMDMATSPTNMDADRPLQQPSRKLSFETYQERGQGQTIQKLVRFGHAEPVMTNFIGIARHAASWLSALKAENILHLSTTCSSFHFLSQKQLLVGDRLSAGALEPASSTHAVALENVARSLQQGSIGLQLVAQEYSILVYSARCEGWDGLDIPNKPNPDAPLRYLIYSSPLSPQAYPSEFCKEPEALHQLIHPNGKRGSELIEVLTELDFKQLLPQDLLLEKKQVYMLLIPLRARQVLGVIMTWLRLHQPDRPIFTVEQPNGWRLFNEAVQGGVGGTVISHADFTLWKLEKIPGLWRLLEDQKYTFWHLDTGEHKQPQFPSNLNAVSVPGTLRFTRLFPFGRAFLITPSFAISEPAKLCTFLKWFRRYAPNTGHILVVCHEFSKFLRNITEEKQREHASLASLNPNNSDVNIFFERAGRRKEDIDDHFRAWELVQELIDRYGDEETSEDIRKIHSLSELIDPSDEQSLVNAFCWWTQLKLDRFRRFYVLGSDPNAIQRAYRYLEIPRYFDTEGSDPDVAGVLLQRQLFAVKHQEEADKHGTEVNIAWGTGGTIDKLSRVVGEWRKSTYETPFSFPSTTFRTGETREIELWIDYQRRRQGNWAGIHPKVVSWCDWNMADQFGDSDQTKSQFDTFSDWFTAPPPFSSRRNTWCGLFYTITDIWDEYMPQRRYERHPWIAIYRPKDVHVFAHQQKLDGIELFIWDIAATDRARFGRPLLDMQCKLVDYVNNTIPQHFDGCTLSDVWYSSTTMFQTNPDDNPLDATCRQINEIFNNTRTVLPAKSKLLREDWIAVDPRLWKKGMSPMTLMKRPMEKASALSLERIPQTEVDKLKPERMIWHPVPGTSKGSKTKCVNDLYQACLKARLEDPECDHIRYQYRPTQEWWADQIEEGRDYGYIQVDAAGKILDKLPSTESTT